jgi:hypothetical protein
MTRVKIFEHDFTGTNGTTLTSAFAFDACPNSSLEIQGNGVDGVGGGGENGNAINQASTTDKDGNTPKATFAPDQYAEITIKSTGGIAAPGVMVRCDPGNQDDYFVDPLAFAGGASIGYHSAGTYNFLASGGATTPGVDDKISLEVIGTTLEAFINSTSQVSTTDSNYATGTPGLYGYDDSGSSFGDDFEAGNMFSRLIVKPRQDTKIRILRLSQQWRANKMLYPAMLR